MIERLLAGEAAFARDDLEIADRLFAQVVEADPRNAIAVVGLARIAVRRGDLERARELAGRALAIDPDEAAASRLLVALDLEAEPEPAPERVPSAWPEPAAEPGPEPAPARRGWRAWLARLLRRG